VIFLHDGSSFPASVYSLLSFLCYVYIEPLPSVPMRILSLLISTTIAILSIVLFRTQILDLATTGFATLTSYYNNNDNDNNNNNNNANTTTQELLKETDAIMTTSSSVPRAIRKVFLAVEQAEGAGARVRRSIGTPQLRNFSPFLMLDHFNVKPGAGFPDHPHRGQETITYILHGAFDHEDFAGNAGTIETGDLQFMTAGRGIMHAEMPRQNADGSANVGLQLWVDLPQKLKKVEPRYRDLRAKEIPQVDVDDKVHVKVISGQCAGVDSVKDLAYTPVWILDIEIKPGGKIVQPVPQGWNAFAYVLEGEAKFGAGEGQKAGPQYHNVVFERDGHVVEAEVSPDAKGSARFALIAGQVLDQPVVQYGPFVLSNKEEVYQALMDYQTKSNGFERADGWQSKIGKSMME
jgi:quercetin 2,3-dioxygenase